MQASQICDIVILNSNQGNISTKSMTNKLSRYCDGIMEAAWLAALILVPVYFNIYSSRIFEPDKIAILRSLALVILGAWIVKLFAEGGIRWERIQPGNSILKFITKFPLIAPVAALVALYLISTVFSVAPRTSLWGSYQRLQGTYTTFSYLIIFVAILGNLRRQAQIDRIITTAVLTSLPVALYGILQRYDIDPIPWAGDTSVRIAANMGNSIFVAAYLIMVFPLSVVRVVQSFNAILKDDERILAQVAQATIYVFVAAIQVIGLYMSGSRGPFLGWLAGSFFLFLLLSLYWRKRWLTLVTIGAALAMGIFLIVFNLEGGPLQNLRSSPAIGRFGLLLDPESNSALVRKYIWQGASELVKPHAPLEYPDGGNDAFNALRPLIGYGPESMYVAYNPFYVPELAIVERRNASPDRSHNETWDALVITGILGILVYLLLFTMVFYYGMKWAGLIPGRKQRNLFLTVWLGVGFFGAAGMALWRGVEYIGVGLPFGMLIGLLIYLTTVAISGMYNPPSTPAESARFLTLIVLIAAIVSHFIEINFGIAIVSTRTYFWTYAALLVVVGYIFPRIGQEGRIAENLFQNVDNAQDLTRRRSSSAKKKRRARSGPSKLGSNWFTSNRQSLISGLIIAIILITLGYDFIANPLGLDSASQILLSALTRLPNMDYAFSLGVLMMLTTSWLFMGVVMKAESPTREDSDWWRDLAIILGVSLMVGLIYWLWHASGLATIAKNSASTFEDVLTQVGRFEDLLVRFNIFLFLLILALAAVISDEIPVRSKTTKLGGILTAPIAMLVVISLSFITNTRIIQADIAFKIAEPFNRGGQWPAAIAIYNRANELAPNEDYYYLFLGRAFLEHAKTLQDISERDRFIQEAENELLRAQKLNPLNTDHTANLARLYNMWASSSTSPEERERKGNISSEYFSKAVKLSRNSAILWDEWASLFLFVLQKPEEAFPRLQRALEIDPKYHRTYAMLGEYYLRKAQAENDPVEVQKFLEEGSVNLKKALELPTPGDSAAKWNYAQMLGGAQLQLGQVPAAIDSYLLALEFAPSGVDVWRLYEEIARLYARIGNMANAQLYIQYALNDAPEDQKEQLRSLSAQLQNLTP